MNETNEQGDAIFGIFTTDEIRRLNKEYKEVHLNPSKSLYQVATRVFRHYNIRTFDDIPGIYSTLFGRKLEKTQK